MPVDDARILVIDDDLFLRDFAVHAIEFGTNRQVTTFESGFHAWQYILEQGNAVDIVIVDAVIPDMNGLELLERIKVQFPEKTVVLTSSNPAYEKTAYQIGADAFLSKPFDINDLFAIMEKFLVASGRSRADGSWLSAVGD